VPEAETLLKAARTRWRSASRARRCRLHLQLGVPVAEPASAEGTPIRMAAARWTRTRPRTAETVHVKVTVENKAAKGQGMVVGDRRPAGRVGAAAEFEQPADLRPSCGTLTEPGLIRLRGGGPRAGLYWRQMGTEQKIEGNLDLVCRVPGEYRGPAVGVPIFTTPTTSTGSTRSRWRWRREEIREGSRE